jgi:hypothetical protein
MSEVEAAPKFRAKYIGDPNDGGRGHSVLNLFGQAFPRGRFVTIRGDEKVVKKLQGNNHFIVEEGEGDAAPAAVEEDDDFEVTAPAKAKARGKKAPDKAAIVTKLDALAAKHPGQVEYDPDASAEALAARLEELQFELGE